eukprot:CAMPEP_0176377014 /NCGR_PEP_ID=MMETSP0126-20121128/28587_1 /TAXON_ID=141414 ORGANISM="Strombidinopsis acuminatum, Strain SPMC142" /NCGR_SAMPLE_ID=MMETSP0126 /ASSEMBLY_ACC=CAM_ASM_000229 /LENGTH=100 /DNA_ID=CAMNT_0017738673 /DNA_START=275 /DNA_END=577 /DNA_ORIENTATION=+
MTIAYVLSAIGAQIGNLKLCLGVMGFHTCFSIVNTAFLITMACWRFSAWGSYCSDDANTQVAPIGQDIGYIFYSQIALQLALFASNYAAKKAHEPIAAVF